MHTCSSSSSSISYAYDVFLNFRGLDTRQGFIGYLYKALRVKEIRPFIDNEGLQIGEEIKPSLAKAIEESRIAIPVFSKNYASSTFCLDELVKIMDCVKGKGRLVFPIFYKVDPRTVRRWLGNNGRALTRRVKRFKDDKGKVERYREALRKAANLTGMHFKHDGNENECDFIEKIVKNISKRISCAPLHVADDPVGPQSRMDLMMELEFTRPLSSSTREMQLSKFEEGQYKSFIFPGERLPVGFESSITLGFPNKFTATSFSVNSPSLQEEQNLTSIDQHKLERCESDDNACNSNAKEDKGKNPLTELLSLTKEETEIYQPASDDETMALDPMELEYQLTIGSNNKSTRSNETGLEELPLARMQSCLCSFFSSLMSLCASSSSLDSP